MKAILLDDFGAPDVMRYGDTERPEPEGDQLLIRVKATSVNRPDLVQRQGHYPPAKGESPLLGLEVAGVVEQIGSSPSSHSKFQVGDRVMALVGGGGYAQYTVAYPEHVLPIPADLSFEQAACICETYITAWLNVMRLGGLRNGESVLVHGGGGGVSTAAIQLVQAMRPESRLFVTASGAKVEATRQLGVADVIDYKNASFSEVVKEQTGRGVDVILDHIGGSYLNPNLACLAVEGRLVIIGVMGGAKAEINLARLMVKRQRILGSVLRSRSRDEKSEIISEFESDVLPHIAHGGVMPMIDTVMPLANAREAHELMESSGHIGKIVLAVS